MLRSKISQYAFKFLPVVIHLRLIRIIIFWCLENMSELLPVNKISETRSLICFYHPQPAYPVHILLVPKKDIRDLSQLDPMEDEFLPDLFTTVRKLVEELGLEQKGYRLIVNGGEYQEFPQLHFHLVSGG
jgi:histidine triad (HIT) family protein